MTNIDNPAAMIRDLMQSHFGQRPVTPMGNVLEEVEERREQEQPTQEPKPPYPWCIGNPTVADCIKAGYCRRNPSCGD